MKRIFLACSVLFCTLSGFAQPRLRADNIDEVLAAMTLEEKVQLLVGYDIGCTATGTAEPLQAFRVPGAAGSTRPIARLGIPSVILADGPAGLRINPKRDGASQTYYCTGFPVGTLMASTSSKDTLLKLVPGDFEDIGILSKGRCKKMKVGF